MTLAISAQPIPLATDSDGVVRVAGTRVTLDTVVAAYQQGLSAEAIAEQYPAVPVEDLYLVLSYYLKHRSSVDAYLSDRRSMSAEVRRENENRFNPNGIRARLLARRK